MDVYDRGVRPTRPSFSWRTVSQGFRRSWRLGLLFLFLNSTLVAVLGYDLFGIPRHLRWFAIGVSLVTNLHVLAWVILREFRAARVHDPNELAVQTGLEVYSVLPWPPNTRPRMWGSLDQERYTEEFVQRFDHLWFALCGKGSDREGRCVLITSAVAGEGKTTLALQLASRCGALGMSTLLIDGDLRRACVCSAVDLPDGPGLSEAILDDEPDPTDMIMPAAGGTFHVLPAGTALVEPCRVLWNRKLRAIIAQFRQTYDVVIIDTPPILPVPDALILGRWADSALLTARSDISRLPEINGALHRLEGAGITVLGIALSGMYTGTQNNASRQPEHAEILDRARAKSAGVRA